MYHVSQLKAAVNTGTRVSPSLPSDIALPRVPMEVLQQRTVPKATGSVEQGLILCPASPVTWLLSRICFICAKPSCVLLLGDQQALKPRGMLLALLLQLLQVKLAMGLGPVCVLVGSVRIAGNECG